MNIRMEFVDKLHWTVLNFFHAKTLNDTLWDKIVWQKPEFKSMLSPKSNQLSRFQNIETGEYFFLNHPISSSHCSHRFWLKYVALPQVPSFKLNFHGCINFRSTTFSSDVQLWSGKPSHELTKDIQSNVMNHIILHSDTKLDSFTLMFSIETPKKFAKECVWRLEQRL